MLKPDRVNWFKTRYSRDVPQIYKEDRVTIRPSGRWEVVFSMQQGWLLCGPRPGLELQIGVRTFPIPIRRINRCLLEQEALLPVLDVMDT